VTENRGVPPISDYAHWNEDAERVWYEENKYDMMNPPEYEQDDYDRPYEDEEIDPDDCAEVNDYHQANTQGRTITFAGVEVYDQQECSNCYIELSVAWPRA
jgi:hypothetical protein